MAEAEYDGKLEDWESIEFMNAQQERQRSQYFNAECTSIDEYTKIGECGYNIFKAQHKVTGDIVAVKKLETRKADVLAFGCNDSFPIGSFRVLKVLQKIKHENIVKLFDVAVGKRLSNVFLVMEYCDRDLGDIIGNLKFRFSPSEVKNIMQQLLTGLNELHEKFFMHRNIKPSNLLIHRSGTIKICGFGTARGNSFKRLSPNIGTACYKAPEILFEFCTYSYPIDIWSAGCVFGELIRRSPLFPGESEIDVITSIIDLQGTPNDRIMPGFSLCLFSRSCNLKQQPYNCIRRSIKNAPHSLVDLIKNMLCYDPNKRFTAGKCLSSEYFREEPSPCENETLRFNVDWKTHNLEE